MAHDPDTLSRSSDHLGNLANILKDLGGGATLLHELTQNANDAQARAIRFTASEGGLEVWNSAEFSDCGSQRETRLCPWKAQGRRSCDLHSFRQVAGRHKADDESTTGAFGVGFTAVYQVTDHPELVTGAWHLILDESLPEDNRIQLCNGGCTRTHGAPGTTFFLPWAKTNTELRQALGSTSLHEPDIALLVAQLHEAATAALIFLEHLCSLEVHSTGVDTVVTRSRTGDRITISVNNVTNKWLLLEGEAAGAANLKARFGRQDSELSSLVQVAVPTSDGPPGRVFAGLPTETLTGWRGHINGTFFPRQDRKTVEFGGQEFHGQWNNLLMDTAARVSATGLEAIGNALGDEVVWSYLLDVELIHRDIAKQKYPAVFAAFFTHAKGAATSAEIALLTSGKRVQPSGVLVPREEDEYEAAAALIKLNLQLLHPSLRSQALQISRSEYGMRFLALADVADGISRAGMVEPWTATSTSLFSDEEAEKLLRLVEQLQRRGRSILADSGMRDVAIVPCVDGSYARARDVSSLEDGDRALFELLAPDLKIVNRERLQALCPSLIELCDDITPARALEIFESDPDALAVAPDQVLEWLADHRGVVNDASKDRVRALPIFPTTTGELLPLTDLSLPSDFDDVLGVANVVDRKRTAGHGDLLRLLGARELDAVEYLIRHVVPAATSGGLSEEQAVSVLNTIYQHRAELEGQPSARHTLAQAPLVLTDQGLKPALQVHLPNRALSLIDPDAPTAALDRLGHLVETLAWLGAARTPNDAVLNAAAVRLGEDEGSSDSAVVLAILDSLHNPPLDVEVPASLRALTSSTWLPVDGGGKARPEEVFAVFQRHLFESQGPHLGLPRAEQQRLSAVLDWLGVRSSPTTAMIIAHLRQCVNTATAVNEQVFRALGEAKEESLVRALSNEACVQVAPGRFVEPAFAFWADPEFGEWAHHLPAGLRQYQAFYDRVGVRESPSPDQVEQLLRLISRASGSDELSDENQAIVHRCWELLDSQLTEARTALAHLGAIKSALGPRGLLEKPQWLLFVDGRRLAEKVLLIRDNLIKRDRTTQRALSAAGVRAAEEVMTANVDDNYSSIPAHTLRTLIKGRLPALERLTEAQRTDDAAMRLEVLSDLQLDLMPPLTVQYVTRFGGTHHVDEPRPTEAIYLSEQHRLIVRAQEPTRHLARELALCIAPRADVSAIAPSILEILRADTLENAMALLDEYGVRDLDQTSWETIHSTAATEVDDTNDSEVDTATGSFVAGQTSGVQRGSVPVSAPNTKPAPAPQHAHATEHHHGGSDGSVREGRRSRFTPNTSRLTSYVSSGEDTHEPRSGDESEKNGLIDQAGVRRVLEHETACGRSPEEQSHTNPGFDVLSRSRDGVVVRRIEVKSIRGAWTDRGVLLSATQFEDARSHPDLYWLYVVEHAEDDDAFEIHRIHNPSGRVTKFGFDSGWRALDEPDVDRGPSGRPSVMSSRSLLGSSDTAPTTE